MHRVCVFAGSSSGHDERHVEDAASLGEALARRSIEIVYGAGRVGVMGALADAALSAGGRVTGVIPEFLARPGILHEGLTSTLVVPDMHVRKAKMAKLSDAFIALPGGYGTMEEICEVVTWAQLGLHHKPVGLFSSAGFFAPFVRLLDHAQTEGFIAMSHRDLLFVATSLADLLRELSQRTPGGRPTEENKAKNTDPFARH